MKSIFAALKNKRRILIQCFGAIGDAPVPAGYERQLNGKILGVMP